MAARRRIIDPPIRVAAVELHGIIDGMSERPWSWERGSRVRNRVLLALSTADFDELVRVQAEGAVQGLGHIFPQDQFPFPVREVRSRWELELADPDIDCFVILDAAGAVSGFAATRGSEFLHFGTAVRTWGTGLAGQAHTEVLAHLIAQGYDHGWLRVFEANERARRFYSRRGWIPTGERTESAFPPNPVLLHYRIDLVTNDNLNAKVQ
jgi:RimJ/RimL family protein N-acetyltransferase